VTDVYGLVVERVCRAAEPPLAFAVEPYILVDLEGRIDGAQVGESAAEAVASGAGFHGGAGCWHGALAGGNEGVKVVVVADPRQMPQGASLGMGRQWTLMEWRALLNELFWASVPWSVRRFRGSLRRTARSGTGERRCECRAWKGPGGRGRSLCGGS